MAPVPYTKRMLSRFYTDTRNAVSFCERDRIAYFAARSLQDPDLSLTDGEHVLLVRRSGSAPLWVCTDHLMDAERLSDLFSTLQCLQEAEVATDFVAKARAVRLFSALAGDKLQTRQTLIACRLHRLCPAEGSGRIGHASKASEQARSSLLKLFAEEAGEAVTEAELLAEARRLRSEPQALVCFAENGEAASLAAVRGTDGEVSLLHSVVTAKAHRGHGYAALLLTELCRRVQSEGRIPILYCDADNAEANALYRKLGFIAAERLVRFTLSDGIGTKCKTPEDNLRC